MEQKSKRGKIAGLSIASNSTLIVLKVAAGVLSGSVSIISEAIHSSIDLLAALIAFFSIRASMKPADKEHPYGHGKIENLSGSLEGLLIFVAALLIAREAVSKLLHPAKFNASYAIAAFSVMVLAGVINLIVSKIMYKTAEAEDSIALEADALHLKTDVFTSFGVAASVLFIAVTGDRFLFIDPVVAIAVAILIVKEAFVLVKKATAPLLDSSLSDEDKSKITSVMDRYQNEIVDYHQLRTRRAGNEKYIEFHMAVNRMLTVEESHRLSDEIESDLKKALPNASINIHIEPDENAVKNEPSLKK